MAKARRLISIIFLALGGFCVAMEVMIAFLAGDGAEDYAGRTLYFAAIAAATLAIGTWASPGRRWRELGLAILIGAFVCVGSLSTVILLPDEKGVVMDKSELTLYLALGPGFFNLGLLVGLGLLLYIRGGGGDPRLLGTLARDAYARIAFTLRLSFDALRGR